MRPSHALLLLTGLAGLCACSESDPGIANSDSAALVEAIRQANVSPGHDTIRLARNGFYILTEEAQAGLLLPGIRGKLTIEGNYSEIRGYSPDPVALLQVEEGSEVRLLNLVLAEGTDGAVRNYGDLRLENVSIVDSSVARMTSIVLNHGSLEATDSQIAYNMLLGNRRDAGTVLNYGEMKLSGSRIHDNLVLGRYPTMAVAGGILNFGSIEADGLELENNQLEGEAAPRLSFGGILNLGNGRFAGSTSNGSVRDAREAEVFAGL